MPPVEGRGRLWVSSCELLYRVESYTLWSVQRQCVLAEPYSPASPRENTAAFRKRWTQRFATFPSYYRMMQSRRRTHDKPASTIFCARRALRGQTLKVHQANLEEQ